MINIEPASAKLVRRIIDIFTEQYGFTKTIEGQWFYNTKESKLFLLSTPVDSLPLEELRINSIGMYVGEINTAQTEIRLSIEGSQIIGPCATKRVLTLTNEEFAKWVRGLEILVNDSLLQRVDEEKGYLLIKNSQNDYFGVARIKNEYLLNFVTKARWVKGHIDDAHE